ncbi:hypothetical protein FS837_002111 [Tulasnella sp. UAMH 9824]|nr:hypothetical protein FS837_002111 [Tulasnella sp. UAMH 9824]
MLESDQHTDLFDPAPPDSRMHYLEEISSKYERPLFPSSQSPYTIHVKGSFHPPPAKHTADDARGSQFSQANGYSILSETGKSTWGNTQQIEERRKAIKMKDLTDLDCEAIHHHKRGGNGIPFEATLLDSERRPDQLEHWRLYRKSSFAHINYTYETPVKLWAVGINYHNWKSAQGEPTSKGGSK